MTYCIPKKPADLCKHCDRRVRVKDLGKHTVEYTPNQTINECKHFIFKPIKEK